MRAVAMALRRLAEQLSLPGLEEAREEHERLVELSKGPEEFPGRWEMEEYLEESPDAERMLGRLGGERVELGDGSEVWTLRDGKDLWVIWEDGGWNIKEDWEFIDGADLEGMYPEEVERFNREFWESPSTLYHNTTEENADGIEEDGLEARDMSRGLTNRDTGAAVFTTSNPDEAVYGSYGPVTFEIDTDAMRRDGYKPFVAQEGPVLEYELQGALAHALGSTWQPEIEQGLSFDTVVVFGDIPAKYLERWED